MHEAHESDSSVKRLLRELQIIGVGVGTLLGGVAVAHADGTPVTKVGESTQISQEQSALDKSTYVDDQAQPTDPLQFPATSLARTTRVQILKQQRICRLQLDRDPYQLSSCQYPTVYTKIAKKDPEWVRSHQLAKPGTEDKEDRRTLLFKVRPAEYHEYQIENLPPKDAARLIWEEEAKWSEEEIAAGMWIIDHENAGWNPCAGNGDDTLRVTCATTTVRNGIDRACGIPQFKPCRLLGDKVGQLRAFVAYIAKRYGSALKAKIHKRKFGWY